MKIGTLKELIKDIPNDMNVGICVNTPAGWVCPDGCIVSPKIITPGFDWHARDVLIIPEFELEMSKKGHDEWVNEKRARKQTR